MKILLSAISVFLAFNVSAAETACSDFNTNTRIAREAVKALVALAQLPNVISYYGGVESEVDDITVVNILPHYQNTKDWYKVSVRNSDCRVTNISLFQEELPLN